MLWCGGQLYPSSFLTEPGECEYRGEHGASGSEQRCMGDCDVAASKGDPEPARDVWEMAMWDPNPPCLHLFWLFSPRPARRPQRPPPPLSASSPLPLHNIRHLFFDRLDRIVQTSVRQTATPNGASPSPRKRSVVFLARVLAPSGSPERSACLRTCY